ncbi:MAG TPA: PfkB family carbohydrate kinase [Chitinophagales bacterium]|nr:PfkB family carbohydrate kinase [Chitinophagales bacterium]
MASNSSITVVGTVAFDALETPFGKTDKIVGGAATYISLAASYFCKHLNLVSVVGGDFPKQQIALMESKGVNTEGLQIKEDEKTFFWSGKYHLDMNTRDTIDTQLNVLATFEPVLPESYRTSEFLMLGNLMPSVQMMVLKQMKTRPKLIVMDTMNFWMEQARPALDEVMKQVDVLSINDAEARELSNEYSLVKAAKKILAMGPKYLIIKKGEHGALLFHDNHVFFAPALPLEDVFDPTGAGDSFAGGFIGYIAASNDISFDNMKRAIIYGSAMASFCVEKFGTERILNLERSEIEERIQEFIDLVQFDISLVD